MNDNLDAEDPTPITITMGQLNQLSHAFNNYQAMAEQVQSLVTEVAQLRLLSITPAPPLTFVPNLPLQAKSLRSSSLTHLPGTDSNLTLTSLAANMSSSHS